MVFPQGLSRKKKIERQYMTQEELSKMRSSEINYPSPEKEEIK
jgi:hypothetical protein